MISSLLSVRDRIWFNLWPYVVYKFVCTSGRTDYKADKKTFVSNSSILLSNAGCHAVSYRP